MTWLCNELAEKRGWDVHLLTFTLPEREPSFPLSARVTLYREGMDGSGWSLRKLGNLWRRIQCIRNCVTRLRPNVVLSFLDSNNLVVILSTLGKQVRVVVSERIDPSQQSFPWIAKIMRAVLYRRAAAIAVQSDRVNQYFLGRGFGQTKIIPNPVTARFLSNQCDYATKRIVAVGRLAEQKGFDVLIESFAKIAKQFPDWSIDIYGEGGSRESLSKLIQLNDLHERVRLCGACSDIEARLVNYSVFAFPSLYEGFPNALAEAMASGLSCVAFSDVSGVDDLIEDGESGLLSKHGDKECFAQKLAELLESEEGRSEFGKTGKRRVADRFSEEVVLNLWKEVLLA